MLQRSPTKSTIESYANTVTSELRRYRDQLNGKGDFETSVRYWHEGSADGLGIITIRVTDNKSNGSEVLSEAIDIVLERLKDRGLLHGIIEGGLALAPDVLVQSDDKIVFAKPLIHRLWLTSAALDDSVRILASVQAVYGSAK